MRGTSKTTAVMLHDNGEEADTNPLLKPTPKKNYKLGIVFVTVILLAGAAVGGFFLFKNSNDKKIVSTNSINSNKPCILKIEEPHQPVMEITLAPSHSESELSEDKVKELEKIIVESYNQVSGGCSDQYNRWMYGIKFMDQTVLKHAVIEEEAESSSISHTFDEEYSPVIRLKTMISCEGCVDDEAFASVYPVSFGRRSSTRRLSNDSVLSSADIFSTIERKLDEMNDSADSALNSGVKEVKIMTADAQHRAYHDEAVSGRSEAASSKKGKGSKNDPVTLRDAVGAVDGITGTKGGKGSKGTVEGRVESSGTKGQKGSKDTVGRSDGKGGKGAKGAKGDVVRGRADGCEEGKAGSKAGSKDGSKSGSKDGSKGAKGTKGAKSGETCQPTQPPVTTRVETNPPTRFVYTPQPTNPPTPRPTPVPVAEAVIPTNQPTRFVYTPQPTNPPTNVPTPLPSPRPTPLPTPRPTPVPVAEAVINPTNQPTRFVYTPQPTNPPTNAPTPLPSPGPTPNPTPIPTSPPVAEAQTPAPTPCADDPCRLYFSDNTTASCDPLVERIIEIDSWCGVRWDPWCVITYNDCFELSGCDAIEIAKIGVEGGVDRTKTKCPDDVSETLTFAPVPIPPIAEANITGTCPDNFPGTGASCDATNLQCQFLYGDIEWLCNCGADLKFYCRQKED